MMTREFVGRLFFKLLVASVFIFLYLPLVVLVLYSFNTRSFPAPWHAFTWDWYHELFRSSHLWEAFLNSLIVACAATLISVLMGILLIYYAVCGGDLSLLARFFYGNLIVPEVVLAVGLLMFFTYFSIPLGFPTLIIAHTVLATGYLIPVVVTRFYELDRGLIEASLDLGATYWQTFRYIIMPLVRPAFFASGLLVFVLSFDDFLLSYFCAGSTAQTLPLYILSMLRSGVSPIVNALSALLLIMSSVLVMAFCWLNRKTRIF
jgi:spermidine/putrescine transport system permease protein